MVEVDAEEYIAVDDSAARCVRDEEVVAFVGGAGAGGGAAVLSLDDGATMEARRSIACEF